MKKILFFFMLHILTHSIQCLSMRGSFTLNRSKDIWQCLFTYFLILRQVSLCDPGWLVLNSTVLLPQPCKSWHELPGLVCSHYGLLELERKYY